MKSGPQSSPLCSLALAAPALADPVAIPVAAAPSVQGPQSGRLLVFAQPRRAGRGSRKPRSIPRRSSRPAPRSRRARSRRWRRAPPSTVDGETGTFPDAFLALPPGTYRFQAVLDRNHDYNYGGRGDRRPRLAGGRGAPARRRAAPRPQPKSSPRPIRKRRSRSCPRPSAPPMRAALDRARCAVDFVSPRLTAFWGRPIHIRAGSRCRRAMARDGPAFPVVYSHRTAIGGTLASAAQRRRAGIVKMAAGDWPPMIWVFLDESSADRHPRIRRFGQ